MTNTKTMTKQETIKQSNGYSKEYNQIRSEAVSKWPSWKVSTYNANFAVSAHAKKIPSK